MISQAPSEKMFLTWHSRRDNGVSESGFRSQERNRRLWVEKAMAVPNPSIRAAQKLSLGQYLSSGLPFQFQRLYAVAILEIVGLEVDGMGG